jgi:hypothetical protein
VRVEDNLSAGLFGWLDWRLFMSRFRLMLLSMLAVFAVGAVASASASAAGQWWVSGAKFSGTEGVTAHLKSGTKSVLKSNLPGGEEIDILSLLLTIKLGDIFGINRGVVEEITLLEAEITVPLGCGLVSPSIIVKPVVTELVVEGAKVFNLFTPKTGTEFTTITITGCAAEGKYKVTGQARCEVQEPTVEAENKVCLFSAATAGATGLKFGTEPATLTAEPEFLLVKKQKWSAKTS